MRRVYKNRDVTDAQRDRILKRQIIELRAEAADNRDKYIPGNSTEAIADFLRNVTVDRHITYRKLRGMFLGLGNLYPQTKQEKDTESARIQGLRQIVGIIRRDEGKYGYLAVVSGIPHTDPETGDIENVLSNVAKEKGARKKHILAYFTKDRSQFAKTHNSTTGQVIKNANRPEKERRRLERIEFERRRNRRNGVM